MTAQQEGSGGVRPPFRLVELPRTPKQLPQRVKRRPLLIVGAVLLLIVVWQLAYPRDRALPFARLDGSMVGGQAQEALAAKIDSEYETTAIAVQVADDTYDTDAAAVGLVPDARKTTTEITRYPLWLRFIPLSMFASGLFTNQSVGTTQDATMFDAYSDTLQQQCAIATTPARLSSESGTVTVVSAKDGRSCADDTIKQAFQDLGLRKAGVTLAVKPDVVVAPGKDVDTTSIAKEAEQIAERTLTLSVEGNATPVAKADIVDWLTLPYDESAKSYDVVVDSDAVQAYVEKAQKDGYVEPGITYIHNDSDGIEQSRDAGNTGKGLDIVPVAKELEQTLLAGGGTVEVSRITLTPTIVYDHPYSPDRAGLQKLLDDLVKNKGDFGIALETANSNLKVSSNGEGTYRPASTYKMIVAWAILKRIDAGQMSWSDQAVIGLTVSECFDTMIIDSNNECGEYFGGVVIGWANLNKMALDLGMTCSDWNAQWYSCAKDEALFLHKLQAGELLNPTQTERLLSVMREQVYRLGIPYGVNWTVADKVGFLYGLLHDASIVYSPYGVYSLVIMTDNSSWGQIADAAWQIDAQLTRMSQ